MSRAYAVTMGRAETPPAVPLHGPRLAAETAHVAMVCYPDAGVLVIQSRSPRTGSCVLDVADLSDGALAALEAFLRSAR